MRLLQIEISAQGGATVRARFGFESPPVSIGSLLRGFSGRGARPTPRSETAPAPEIAALRQGRPRVSDSLQGLINLDVVVTNNSGKPISSLGPEDFASLDNGQPQTIISFHEYDGISSKPDPPVGVILLIDTIEMRANLAAFEQEEEVERFLRRNGGPLGQPVSIFGLSYAGFWTLAQPSGDGNHAQPTIVLTGSNLCGSGPLSLMVE